MRNHLDQIRLARAAVKRSRLILARKGMTGEAARMQSMSDIHGRFALESLERAWPRIVEKRAGARQIVWELSVLVSYTALQAELGMRQTKAEATI